MHRGSSLERPRVWLLYQGTRPIEAFASETEAHLRRTTLKAEHPRHTFWIQPIPFIPFGADHAHQ